MALYPSESTYPGSGTFPISLTPSLILVPAVPNRSIYSGIYGRSDFGHGRYGAGDADSLILNPLGARRAIYPSDSTFPSSDAYPGSSDLTLNPVD